MPGLGLILLAIFLILFGIQGLGARLGFPIAITSQTRVTDELALQVVCAVAGPGIRYFG